MTERIEVMGKSHWLLGLVLVSCLVLATQAFGAGHGHERPAKQGILLVAFGSSVPEAQVAFDNIDRKVKAAFPGVPVRWAYTSSIIRKKLAKEGKELDSVAVALAKMMDEGFTQVAVQSLHTIRGEEFDDLVHTAYPFKSMPEGIPHLIVGSPLLSNEDDMNKVTAAILANLPKDRRPDEAVVLMGHGTPHPANAVYAALMFHLQRRDPNVFVATVEGSPDINDALEMLKERKLKKAYLVPFMSVAGDHARNDMAGDEADSWKNVLGKAGIQTEAILKGTAEYDNMVEIWLDHLRAVMKHFQ